MKRSTTLTVLSLASALAVAGCGTSGAQDSAGTVSETATPATSAPDATGNASASGEPIAEEHDDDDVMFAQMMIPHHEQAVQMSETLLAKDAVPAQVRDFAQKVIDAQGPEIERMDQMLSTWGAPATPDDGDTGHGGHGSGMMTEEDMGMLNDAQGAEAARLYLEQMTVHHEGAVEMAQVEVENGSNSQAVQLARDIISAQEAEITEMEELLKELPSQS
ncbi:DUF305 domain-containing protein [Kocuria dechangensis]|uniref:DUF305 domain-containing protein n=1 Tax=Kocuria dechangensis TaxID=1176249 RepID=A0A917LVZ8_9MICC|nr:DUF305 domain-containing protein [Kocuria dechangensis]GGG62104.1 DUF305 domain-containing protein [Kocuria dechangensis]